MSRIEKINFIKEITILEGGCIVLKNKLFGNFQINYILSSGIIKDQDRTSGKKYDMPIRDLADDYIDYVFNEIDNVRYDNETIFTEIFDTVNSELGHIKFTNSSLVINEQNYVIDTIKLNLKTNIMSVLYWVNDRPMAALDIFDLQEDIIVHIKEQIKYNKYL